MWSNTPVYVAGFDRGVRPIGDWSMSMTLSSCSQPGACACACPAERASGRPSASARGSSTSWTSVDLPLPRHAGDADEQPQRDVDRDVLAGCARWRPPVGARACRGLRRTCGVGICRRPDRYAPGQRRSSSSRPLQVAASTRSAPPCSPAPGPMSTTWSAAWIVASSCSTTISVLPEVAEPEQRVDQAAVVALVQPDRRLVQDVEHADQRRCRSAWPAGSAAPRRRPACPRARPASGSRARRPPGTPAARGSPSAAARRSGARARTSSIVVDERRACRGSSSAVSSEMLLPADRDGQASRASGASPLQARHGTSRMNCSSRSRCGVGVGLGVAALDVRGSRPRRWCGTSADRPYRFR